MLGCVELPLHRGRHLQALHADTNRLALLARRVGSSAIVRLARFLAREAHVSSCACQAHGSRHANGWCCVACMVLVDVVEAGDSVLFRFASRCLCWCWGRRGARELHSLTIFVQHLFEDVGFRSRRAARRGACDLQGPLELRGLLEVRMRCRHLAVGLDALRR